MMITYFTDDEMDRLDQQFLQFKQKYQTLFLDAEAAEQGLLKSLIMLGVAELESRAQKRTKR